MTMCTMVAISISLFIVPGLFLYVYICVLWWRFLYLCSSFQVYLYMFVWLCVGWWRFLSLFVVPGLGLSASYTVLLTWLMSMVPENYDFLIKKPEDLEQVPFYPPFYVLGMQQLWMDENLCLVVAVTPHPHCNTKAMPNKQKKSKTKVLWLI